MIPLQNMKSRVFSRVKAGFSAWYLCGAKQLTRHLTRQRLTRFRRVSVQLFFVWIKHVRVNELNIIEHNILWV